MFPRPRMTVNILLYLLDFLMLENNDKAESLLNAHPQLVPLPLSPGSLFSVPRQPKSWL